MYLNWTFYRASVLSPYTLPAIYSITFRPFLPSRLPTAISFGAFVFCAFTLCASTVRLLRMDVSSIPFLVILAHLLHHNRSSGGSIVLWHCKQVYPGFCSPLQIRFAAVVFVSRVEVSHVV